MDGSSLRVRVTSACDVVSQRVRLLHATASMAIDDMNLRDKTVLSVIDDPPPAPPPLLPPTPSRFDQQQQQQQGSSNSNVLGRLEASVSVAWSAAGMRSMSMLPPARSQRLDSTASMNGSMASSPFVPRQQYDRLRRFVLQFDHQLQSLCEEVDGELHHLVDVIPAGSQAEEKWMKALISNDEVTDQEVIGRLLESQANKIHGKDAMLSAQSAAAAATAARKRKSISAVGSGGGGLEESTMSKGEDRRKSSVWQSTDGNSTRRGSVSTLATPQTVALHQRGSSVAPTDAAAAVFGGQGDSMTDDGGASTAGVLVGIDRIPPEVMAVMAALRQECAEATVEAQEATASLDLALAKLHRQGEATKMIVDGLLRQINTMQEQLMSVVQRVTATVLKGMQGVASLGGSPLGSVRNPNASIGGAGDDSITGDGIDRTVSFQASPTLSSAVGLPQQQVSLSAFTNAVQQALPYPSTPLVVATSATIQTLVDHLAVIATAIGPEDPTTHSHGRRASKASTATSESSSKRNGRLVQTDKQLAKYFSKMCYELEEKLKRNQSVMAHTEESILVELDNTRQLVDEERDQLVKKLEHQQQEMMKLRQQHSKHEIVTQMLKSEILTLKSEIQQLSFQIQDKDSAMALLIETKSHEEAKKDLSSLMSLNEGVNEKFTMLAEVEKHKLEFDRCDTALNFLMGHSKLGGEIALLVHQFGEEYTVSGDEIGEEKKRQDALLAAGVANGEESALATKAMLAGMPLPAQENLQALQAQRIAFENKAMVYLSQRMAQRDVFTEIDNLKKETDKLRLELAEKSNRLTEYDAALSDHIQPTLESYLDVCPHELSSIFPKFKSTCGQRVAKEKAQVTALMNRVKDLEGEKEQERKDHRLVLDFYLNEVQRGLRGAASRMASAADPMKPTVSGGKKGGHHQMGASQSMSSSKGASASGPSSTPPGAGGLSVTPPGESNSLVNEKGVQLEVPPALHDAQMEVESTLSSMVDTVIRHMQQRHGLEEAKDVLEGQLKIQEVTVAKLTDASERQLKEIADLKSKVAAFQYKEAMASEGVGMERRKSSKSISRNVSARGSPVDSALDVPLVLGPARVSMRQTRLPSVEIGTQCDLLKAPAGGTTTPSKTDATGASAGSGPSSSSGVGALSGSALQNNNMYASFAESESDGDDMPSEGRSPAAAGKKSVTTGAVTGKGKKGKSTTPVTSSPGKSSDSVVGKTAGTGGKASTVAPRPTSATATKTPTASKSKTGAGKAEDPTEDLTPTSSSATPTASPLYKATMKDAEAQTGPSLNDVEEMIRQVAQKEEERRQSETECAEVQAHVDALTGEVNSLRREVAEVRAELDAADADKASLVDCAVGTSFDTDAESDSLMPLEVSGGVNVGVDAMTSASFSSIRSVRRPTSASSAATTAAGGATLQPNSAAFHLAVSLEAAKLVAASTDPATGQRWYSCKPTAGGIRGPPLAPPSKRSPVTLPLSTAELAPTKLSAAQQDVKWSVCWRCRMPSQVQDASVDTLELEEEATTLLKASASGVTKIELRPIAVQTAWKGTDVRGPPPPSRHAQVQCDLMTYMDKKRCHDTFQLIDQLQAQQHQMAADMFRGDVGGGGGNGVLTSSMVYGRPPPMSHTPLGDDGEDVPLSKLKQRAASCNQRSTAQKVLAAGRIMDSVVAGDAVSALLLMSEAPPASVVKPKAVPSNSLSGNSEVPGEDNEAAAPTTWTIEEMANRSRKGLSDTLVHEDVSWTGGPSPNSAQVGPLVVAGNAAANNNRTRLHGDDDGVYDDNSEEEDRRSDHLVMASGTVGRVGLRKRNIGLASAMRYVDRKRSRNQTGEATSGYQVLLADWHANQLQRLGPFPEGAEVVPIDPIPRASSAKSHRSTYSSTTATSATGIVLGQHRHLYSRMQPALLPDLQKDMVFVASKNKATHRATAAAMEAALFGGGVLAANQGIHVIRAAEDPLSDLSITPMSATAHPGNGHPSTVLLMNSSTGGSSSPVMGKSVARCGSAALSGHMQQSKHSPVIKGFYPRPSSSTAALPAHRSGMKPSVALPGATRGVQLGVMGGGLQRPSSSAGNTSVVVPSPNVSAVLKPADVDVPDAPPRSSSVPRPGGMLGVAGSPVHVMQRPSSRGA